MNACSDSEVDSDLDAEMCPICKAKAEAAAAGKPDPTAEAGADPNCPKAKAHAKELLIEAAEKGNFKDCGCGCQGTLKLL